MQEELSERSKMYIGLDVKYTLPLSDFNGSSSLSTDFEKYPNIKFNGNPSKGRRGVPYGQTDGYDEASRFSQFCERA
jgi:hypothetical protein